MNRNSYSMYIAAICPMVIATPGRLAAGIALSLELCLLMLAGTGFRQLVRRLGIGMLQELTMLSFIIFFTLLWRQLLILMSPELALELGFVMYFPALSTFAALFLFDAAEDGFLPELRGNMLPVLRFSAYTAGMSLIRDVCGYGTLTFIAAHGTAETVVIRAPVSVFIFLATVPGALIFAALSLIGYLAALKKMRMFSQMEAAH